MPSLRLIEGSPAPLPSCFALAEFEFRPPNLLARAFAALSLALWALQFSGVLEHEYVAGPVWHAHEMRFGSALAVIVGFVCILGSNWKDQPTNGPSTARPLKSDWHDAACYLIVLLTSAVRFLPVPTCSRLDGRLR